MCVPTYIYIYMYILIITFCRLVDVYFFWKSQGKLGEFFSTALVDTK